MSDNRAELCVVATTNQCGLSVGADNEAFLSADAIKQRWISPHLTHCGALSATTQLESLCTYFVLCMLTDILICFGQV